MLGSGGRCRDLGELDVLLLSFLLATTKDQAADHNSYPHDQFSPVNDCTEHIKRNMKHWQLTGFHKLNETKHKVKGLTE